jgi:hypothetical protein
MLGCHDESMPSGSNQERNCVSPTCYGGDEQVVDKLKGELEARGIPCKFSSYA